MSCSALRANEAMCPGAATTSLRFPEKETEMPTAPKEARDA
jgi:hypothetical protein